MLIYVRCLFCSYIFLFKIQEVEPTVGVALINIWDDYPDNSGSQNEAWNGSLHHAESHMSPRGKSCT